MIELLMKLAERSPMIRRWIWLRWYQYLAGYNVRDWHFMNYGYQSLVDESEPLKLENADEQNRYSIQLYDRVARAIDLRGKTIVEIGSGRGGGCSYVHRYHHPALSTGLDFSAKAVRFCQATHRHPGLNFVRGDAEKMPFANESFDAVINVESSHCYGSMPKFFSEVQRVLKPGGSFLFADFRTPETSAQLHQLFVESKMQLVEHEVITKEVLHALKLDSERKLRRLEQAAPKRILGTLKRFAAIEGSDVYESFANGTFVYERYHLKMSS